MACQALTWAMDLEKTPDSKLTPLQYTALAQRCIYLFIDNAQLTLQTIVDHVVNGGSMIGLAKVWDIRYSDTIRWLRGDDARWKEYIHALEARDEWAIESILNEIKEIGHADLRLLYDSDGVLKPIQDWPDDIAKAVSSVETMDTKGGRVMKVKTIDKMKALELYGKKLALFIDRHEHTADDKLSALIEQTYKSDVDKAPVQT